MFAGQFLVEIEQAFDIQMERLGSKKKAVLDTVKQCTEQETKALKCLYASMPISDAVDYSPALFYAYAKHGTMLWESGPFAGKVPEELFAGYVLHHRVNNEDLTNSRAFFYEQLKQKIEKMSMEEAILTINYWCASQATYRTTDGRTLSAEAVYRWAYGRCGEESTFAVSVLRSMGIPAKQVYVPLWSHCDDNHAWVEVWCDGVWKFLGACEPEEILNKGWFTGASSRAMMVHSRSMLPGIQDEAVAGKKGMSLVLNQLGRYANAVNISVAVLHQDGRIAEGARVSFEVLNYACFGEIAMVYTQSDGTCTLQTGIGTVHITAFIDGAYGELLVHTGEQQSCEIVLGQTEEKKEVWQQFVMNAPKDTPVNPCIQTEEEIAQGRRKQKEAAGIREKKAKGNEKEIQKFLQTSDNEPWPEYFPELILASLKEKDFIDITADILEENCKEAMGYEQDYPRPIFGAYVLCPRVDNEMIRPFRCFIKSHLSEQEKAAIRKNPANVWTLVNQQLKSNPEWEYGNLITSAEGALTSGYGSALTKKVVSVQILRTLGIASRLNPADGIIEIYTEKEFVPIEEQKIQTRTCAIVIKEQPQTEWTYFQNWTIAKLEQDGYKTLRLGSENGEKIVGAIPLFPGTYRIITANRLPNGNIFGKKVVLDIRDGETREIELQQKEAEPSDMLAEHTIEDFKLRLEDGTCCLLSRLVEKQKSLFIWLEEGAEPTEHILNELYERREAYSKISAAFYVVIRDKKAKEDQSLAKALHHVPGVQILFDEFGADMEVLARRMYLEPGNLPLIAIVDEHMRGIYGSAGYNVGTADMILKILNI